MADEPTTHTTVVEKSSSGGTLLIGLVLIIALVVGAFFVFNEGRTDGADTKAATEAVGDAAKKPAD